MLGVGFGVIGLILWLAMIVVTVLVVYWIWVIQDRSDKIAHDLDRMLDLLVARAGRSSLAGESDRPAGTPPAAPAASPPAEPPTNPPAPGEPKPEPPGGE